MTKRLREQTLAAKSIVQVTGIYIMQNTRGGGDKKNADLVWKIEKGKRLTVNYCISKKSWPISYCNLRYEMGQDSLDRQNTIHLYCSYVIYIKFFVIIFSISTLKAVVLLYLAKNWMNNLAKLLLLYEQEDIIYIVRYSLKWTYSTIGGPTIF